MNEKPGSEHPARKVHLVRILALIVVFALVLIMLWCVRVAPLPHKFP